MAVEPLAHDVAGDGPGLVLVHGVTFNRRTWDPIVSRLAERFRCLVVDLPGHGESTGSGADPVATVERIHATSEAVGLQTPIVLGHSAGALVATGYAAMHPVAGVVNVDQSLRVGPFASFVQQLAPALSGPGFADAFTPFRQSIGVDQLPEPERTRVLATQRVDQQTVLDHWTKPLHDSPEQLQEEVNGLLEAVVAPYLWLVGSEPAREDVDLLRAHLRGPLQVECWPGTGHMVHLSDPERFSALVAKFAGVAP